MSKSVVETVAKLLALAIDQEGAPEGEAARRKADELMRRHQIAADDLTQREIETRPLLIPAAMWRRRLLNASALYSEVLMLFVPGREVSLIGFPWRVDLAIYLNESLLNQMKASVKRWKKEAILPPSRSDMNRYRSSFVTGVEVKVDTLRRRESEQQENGAAEGLILRNHQDYLLARKVAEENGPVKRHRSREEKLNLAGVREGMKASLSTALPERRQPLNKDRQLTSGVA